MIGFLTDEDFNGRIVRGLFLQKSDLDLVRVQDVNLMGKSDDAVLEWANDNNRLLLTHDRRTMPGHARDRLAAGGHVPGIFIVDDLAPIGACIEDIVLVAECSEQDEWRDQIHYLPFSA
jgi:hypothetical protein